MTAPTTRRPPPPPPPGKAAVAAPAEPAKTFSINRGVKKGAERVVIYGEGGIGKSSLAALAPAPLFIDVEGSSNKIDTARVGGIQTFRDVLGALREPSLWKDIETAIIDSGTAAQELAIAHTIATVPHEKGNAVKSLEDYGWGKGYTHVYETFLLLLAELDRHYEKGRNVVLVCHVTTERAPNPSGEDYLQYQPALLMPPKQGQIRPRVRDWADHLLFLQYDRAVKDGKATGSGSRTIYPQAQAHFWAKSRTLRDPIEFIENDNTLWTSLLENAHAAS